MASDGGLPAGNGAARDAVLARVGRSVHGIADEQRGSGPIERFDDRRWKFRLLKGIQTAEQLEAVVQDAVGDPRAALDQQGDE